MKSTLKNVALLFILSLTLFSCRTEETELIETPPEQTLAANSNVATLIQNTVTNDGSYDNILDGASCFDIQLPITVVANGEEVTINNEDDIDIVEDIFDEFPDDVDTLEINFPITIIKEDYTTMVINSQGELNAAALQCDNDGNDDDIECIDFQYPITANIFNQNNEQIDTIVFNNDEELFDFIDDLDDMDVIVVFEFPITVILSDGSTEVVNNFDELEDLIEDAIDDCDEDDDNDPNDDDCDDCTTDQLLDILTGCEEWMVDKLERDDQDLEDIYVGYLFHFNEDGSLSVENSTDNFSGTWEANGSGNNIDVIINIPNLSDFNDTWRLHEIDDDIDAQIDLRIDDDKLRFESDCTDGGDDPDDTVLVEALTNGDWHITYFFDDEDETADFADYVFNFTGDGIATATDPDGTTNGTWSTSSGDETDLELNLNFGQSIPLDELADDWDVLEVTQDIIRLKDISGGDGSEDFLTFEREPFDGGGNGDDLETILANGTWVVAQYTDDGSDETADYDGYEMDFNSNGTVIAESTTNTIDGDWDVLSNGNTLLLDFGNDIPFDEFNDDWDVLSFSETMIELQDVSGGNGGTDTLILEKL